MAVAQGNVLIADDEETIRWLLNKKLSKEGYHCDEAGSGEQALEKLRINPTELVILDINMPGKLGTEILPEITGSFPDTAVIMASGITEPSVIVQCIEDGAQDYLCKPFSLDEVSLSVGRALEKRDIEVQIRQYQQHLKQKAGQQMLEIRESFLDAIEALVFELETSDKYTAGHSRRVTQIALVIGEEIGLPSDELEDLRWGTLLHDVGKIAIDPRILNKPSQLTGEEYRYVMSHAIIGPRIVRPFVNERVVDIISHHHDHYDGNGLDQVVAGEDIPLGARILAVADAFGAMTSDRPYRPAMAMEEALEEIKLCSGSQFAPSVASTFLKIAMDELAVAHA